ncbi:hypothetical protein PHYC_02702 [Phycisphaerales bacterium]|nr:hypothetical protein PHYC_02702 [Phycisphaerales bacterium]
MHCGHKGLFFDRLDVGVAESAVPGASAEQTPRLVPFAHSIYHNRNRAYNPQFGRFMQMDPNATALTLVAFAAFNGQTSSAVMSPFDLDGRFQDGSNLYQYLGGNSWINQDPFGTFMGLSELAWSTAQRGMLMGMVFGGVGGAIKGFNKHREAPLTDRAWEGLKGMFMGAAIGGVAGLLGGAIAAQLAPGIGLAQSAFACSTSGLLASISAHSVGGAASAGIYSGLDQLYETGTINPSQLAEDMAWGAILGAVGGAMTGRACFAADTQVWTPTGPCPIQLLCVGARVLTDTQSTETLPVRESEWRLLGLEMPDNSYPGAVICIHTLKPVHWIEAWGIEAGTGIPYDMPEMGIEGIARVLSIEACPRVVPGPGRIVLSTFRRLARNIRKLYVNDRQVTP